MRASLRPNLLHRLHLRHLRNVRLQIPLNPHLQRNHAARATHARAVKPNLHHALRRDINQFKIPTIRLHGWSNEFDDTRNAIKRSWRITPTLIRR